MLLVALPLVPTGAPAGAAASIASSADIVVDGPPGVECPEAAFASIQPAVAAAAPGSTIRVCPGRYEESVSVPKTLTLIASRLAGRAPGCPSGAATDPTRYAIVTGDASSSTGFTLAANAIVIDGFVVDTSGDGIRADPAFSGYQIRHVVAQNQEGIGIQLDSSGVLLSVAERNCLREIHGEGMGIRGTSLRNAVIRENSLTATTGGITVNGQDVSIVRNDLFRHFAGITAHITGVIEHNRVIDASDQAVFVSGQSGGAVNVSFNLIEGGSNGIAIVGSNAVAERNTIRVDSTGIHIGGSDNTIEGNLVDGGATFAGIVVGAGTSNLVRGNVSRQHPGDGLRVTAEATANTLERNVMLGNGEHDCHDDSVGSGTAGTANFWINDLGRTENRPGLCKNATVP